MSAWGTAAWDNDTAADWFGDLFDATQLVRHVDDALALDPESDPDVIRAASHLLIQLGRGYIWPIRELDRQLALAVRKMEVVKGLEVFREAKGFVEAIDADIAALKSQITKSRKA
jgi:hypothetical protein